MGTSLDGVKHQEFPAAWNSYKPAYVPPGPLGQLQVLDLNEYLSRR